MSQFQLEALRIVVQQKKVIAEARKEEWHQALRSLDSTQGEANALIISFVKESISAYNNQGEKKRIDTEHGMYVNVDLMSMRVSVTFDIFYPPMEERNGEEIARMTHVEEQKVSEFLSKDLVQRFTKAGYKLKIEKVEYDWNV